MHVRRTLTFDPVCVCVRALASALVPLPPTWTGYEASQQLIFLHIDL